MFNYLLKKIFYAGFTLWGVVTAIFILFTILPGDPARMMLDQNENPEQLRIIKQKFGFDQPLSTQYLYYLNDLSPLSFHSTESANYTHLVPGKYNAMSILRIGDTNIAIKTPYLRESFQKNGKKVTDIISNVLPNTLILALSAIIIALSLGIILGVFSALYKNSILDRFIAIVSTLGMSVPSFFAAILFAWLFGFVLHRYTNLNMNGSLYEVDDFGEGNYIQIKNLILPAIVLGIRPLGVITQLMRNSLLEILSQDYIRTAHSKGLSSFNIIYKHALKNALNPVITAISGWFASMLAGAVFVEYVFGWNGLGKEIVEALNTLDLPVIMGSVLVISSAFVLITIIVDILYAYIDPKIRL
ncbi:MAG: ABC transporter permease [Flavobacteriales bacterium]|nr:ABC transporter permease [Flavobacteriales bacterium]